jgi:hypothetical protein
VLHMHRISLGRSGQTVKLVVILCMNEGMMINDGRDGGIFHCSNRQMTQQTEPK